MKATELRIGNWVMYSSIIKVNENKIIECVDHPDRFAPIPLTEEWLERFGFVKCDTPHYSRGEFYILRDFYYWTSYSGLVVNGYDPIDEVSIIVKHVHQLQNLYFALTGKELNQNKEDDNNTNNLNDNSISSV